MPCGEFLILSKMSKAIKILKCEMLKTGDILDAKIRNDAINFELCSVL